MLKKILPLLFFSALFFFFAIDLHAAMGPPGPPMGPPPCWPPPCSIPLDGGISLLIAAGAALGGKKIFDRRKKQ
ncbi:MAG: hypothetical protein HY841_14315 [Bacteroidetes bacterium]|nr:hypothetical protein [Bacteroidota bacterium]